MGLYRTDHIVYGWKLPETMQDSKGEEIDFWEDKFLPMIEGHQGEEYVIIRGEISYTVFGLGLKRGGDQYEGWQFEPLEFGNLDAEKVKAKYREVFGDEPAEEPHLFIFSNFS